MKTGCIAYLTRSDERELAKLTKSLSLLQTHYLAEHPCDVIIFHEADLPASRIIELAKASGISAKCALVEFRYTHAGAPLLSKRDLGYRHMCRFFANELFQRPELMDYEYYCRLDTDSYILSPIVFDLFEFAKAQAVDYGYIAVVDDEPKFCHDLWATAEQYINAHPEIPTYRKLYTEIPEAKCFYTNFEVCRLAWFRRPVWQDYFKHLDATGGIFRHRWGDHVIRYIGVNLFIQQPQIHQFRNIHYAHQGEFNVPGLRGFMRNCLSTSKRVIRRLV
jgi:hypothetical protein